LSGQCIARPFPHRRQLLVTPHACSNKPHTLSLSLPLYLKSRSLSRVPHRLHACSQPGCIVSSREERKCLLGRRVAVVKVAAHKCIARQHQQRRCRHCNRAWGFRNGSVDLGIAPLVQLGRYRLVRRKELLHQWRHMRKDLALDVGTRAFWLIVHCRARVVRKSPRHTRVHHQHRSPGCAVSRGGCSCACSFPGINGQVTHAIIFIPADVPTYRAHRKRRGETGGTE
jgi:hypothetical protein